MRVMLIGGPMHESDYFMPDSQAPLLRVALYDELQPYWSCEPFPEDTANNLRVGEYRYEHKFFNPDISIYKDLIVLKWYGPEAKATRGSILHQHPSSEWAWQDVV